jgi:hypothetical protein
MDSITVSGNCSRITIKEGVTGFEGVIESVREQQTIASRASSSASTVSD